MFFVIAYSRAKGELLSYELFAEDQRSEANGCYERLLHRYIAEDSGNVEVNVFESESESDFKVTHARYFETTAEAIESLRRAIS